MVLLLALGIAFGPKLAGAWHPSETSFPIQGIDVSHHQGPIAWAELPDQGVDFAYIKATEGGDHVDSRFATNWAGASAASIRRGAYHFFTLCRSGADQAANFLGVVPTDALALPPAVDLEYLGNCGARPDRARLHKELADFLRIVETRYGQQAVLYLTKEFDDAFSISASFDRPLWLRRIILRPNFGGKPWTFWQTSNFRRLRGIRGRVDWNVARSDLPPSQLTTTPNP